MIISIYKSNDKLIVRGEEIVCSNLYSGSNNNTLPSNYSSKRFRINVEAVGVAGDLTEIESLSLAILSKYSIVSFSLVYFEFNAYT